MSETLTPQDGSREDALHELGTSGQSLLATQGRSKRLGGVIVVGLAVLGIGAVAMFRPEQQAIKPSAENEIAAKRPVPKLRENQPQEEDAGASAPVRAAPQVPAVATGEPSEQAQQIAFMREQEEQQRQAEERKLQNARMKSSIIPPNFGGGDLVGSGQGGAAAEASAGEPAQDGRAAAVARPSQQGSGNNLNLAGFAADDAGAGVGGGMAGTDANSRFARGSAGQGVAVSRASRLDQLECRILQGKILEAVLEPRAISDLPGTVCAVIQRDVYGAQGRNVLVPWGSRVCGSYNADLRKGQERLFTIWNTLRAPDGTQVAIDSPGADQLGSAGQGGEVDTHFATIFGTSALLSIIGAGATTVNVSTGDQANSQSYYRQAVQQAAAQSAQQALQPYLSIPPTITVPAASRVRIYVNRDLDFTALCGQARQQRQRIERAPAAALAWEGGR